MSFLNFLIKNKGQIQNRPSSNSLNQEFSQEIPLITKSSSTDKNTTYLDNGIILTKMSDKLNLSYDGLLVKSGAQDVYAVIGYGDNQNWHNIEYYQMNKTSSKTYELIFPIKNSVVNIVFKDGANNWDNNSSLNYTFCDIL